MWGAGSRVHPSVPSPVFAGAQAGQVFRAIPHIRPHFAKHLERLPRAVGLAQALSRPLPAHRGRVNLIERSEIPSESEAVSVARAPPHATRLPPSLDARPERPLSADVSALTRVGLR